MRLNDQPLLTPQQIAGKHNELANETKQLQQEILANADKIRKLQQQHDEINIPSRADKLKMSTQQRRGIDKIVSEKQQQRYAIQAAINHINRNTKSISTTVEQLKQQQNIPLANKLKAYYSNALNRHYRSTNQSDLTQFLQFVDHHFSQSAPICLPTSREFDNMAMKICLEKPKLFTALPKIWQPQKYRIILKSQIKKLTQDKLEFNESIDTLSAIKVQRKTTLKQYADLLRCAISPLFFCYSTLNYMASNLDFRSHTPLEGLEVCHERQPIPYLLIVHAGFTTMEILRNLARWYNEAENDNCNPITQLAIHACRDQIKRLKKDVASLNYRLELLRPADNNVTLCNA